MWRRKTNNPPAPPPPLPYQIADPAADAPSVEELRWKIHSCIDGMDEYMLRMVWSFLIVFYPNDTDAHCRR